MSLRERLLFLLIPLIILPLVFITVTALFLVRQIPYPVLTHPYATVALIFIGIVSVAAIGILISVANSVSHPLKTLTELARKIADGDWNTAFPAKVGTTELDQLAQAIEKMKIEIKGQQDHIRKTAADAAVGQIASHVAHDLASPLSAMQAALGYFSEMNSPDAKMPDYLNLLELSSKRVKAISKELLDYKKGQEPKKVLFSIHKLLDELIGEYATQPQYNCVEFSKHYHSESVFIFGDRAKIQRAFGNLIKNAVEAMDKCGTLTVTTRRSEEKVLIEIQDTGCGMTAEILEKVLQGGFSHGKVEGHGIGTMVIRKTLAEHGGALSACSEVSVGTTFFVELPLPESVQVQGADREEEMVESFEILSKKGEPILVMDDDVVLLEQWRLALEREKKIALLCTSFEDFLEQGFSARLSKTAIVDYHFENSELNGIDVLRRLKEKGFKHLYLCTVEYWKPSLQKQAAELNVKICPKPLPKIFVTSTSSAGVSSCVAREEPKHIGDIEKGRGYTVLVIDDDASIRFAWKLMDRKLQIENLHLFPSWEATESAHLNLSEIDIAFIDKNIEGSRYGGAEVVQFLKSRGIAKVILASGENSEDLCKDPLCLQADFVMQDKIPNSLKEFFS